MALTLDGARKLAMALEGTIEQDHHGFPSFRIGGKIFASLPDDEHAHVMLEEDAIRVAVEHHPHCCEEKWWGKKLAAVRVSLPDCEQATLSALLADAWRVKSARPSRK
jgi:hypothetical protein